MVISNFFRDLFKITYVASCGHKCIISDELTAFGQTIIYTLPIKGGKIEYCHKCLGKMTIRCAWCGNPIFIGDFITLYRPTRKKDFVIPSWAVIYDNKKEQQLVGCQRKGCVDSNTDYCGHWLPPGKVKAVIQLSKNKITLSDDPNYIVLENEEGKTMKIMKFNI